MAEAIGAAILSSVAVESTVVVGTLTTATIVGTAALTAGTLGLQFLVGSMGSDQKQKVAAQQFSTRQPMPVRRRGYGRSKLSGPKIAYDSSGGRFYAGYYLAEGPIDGIEQFWLDDKLAGIPEPTLTGPSGVAPWFGAVVVDARLGTVGQTASGLLTPLPYWSAQHRLDGCAYVAVLSIAPAEKTFKKIFPSGRPPEARVVARLSKVRNVADPAQTTDPATWHWSDRAGPCLYDFITHPTWGLRVPDTLMNKPSWTAFDQLCDETVYDRDGVGHPRYILGGLYEMSDDPADTLAAMLDTCDGRLTLEPDGTIGITGGRMPEPTVTLTDPTILSLVMEEGSGKLAAFNRLKTSFTSPNHDWQTVQGAPWIDAGAQDYAGELLEADFARPWVIDHNQLQRLAKIHTAKGNPDLRITGMVTDLSGAPALFEDAIRLVLTEYGVDAVILVNRAVANLADGTCTFDLVSLRPDAYEFDAATEEGVPPALPGTQAEAAPPDPPASLVALVERRAVSGDTSAVFVRLLCTVPSREDVTLIGHYRRVGDTAWIDMAPEGDNRGMVISSVLADGETYEMQGAIATYGRSLQSAWTNPSPATIVATADPTVPGAPAIAATGGAGGATIALTAPGSANVAALRLYRAAGAGAAFGAATLIQTVNVGPNQSVSLADAPLAATTYRYWATAANASGVPSAPAGPANAVVT